MNKNFVISVLQDYLQALYRCGTEEEQNTVLEAIKEVEQGE